MDDPAYERATIAGREIELLRRGRGRPLLYLHAGDGIEPSLGFVERLSRSFKVTAASHPGSAPRRGTASATCTTSPTTIST
jgi:hypothetical protein